MTNAEENAALLREIEVLQDRLNKLFKRPNEDPIFTTEKQLRDAVSDNPRYFAADRRSDLAEILFATLDFIYERVADGDSKELFCNPLPPGSSLSRLPEPEMLCRIVMPLGWSLAAAWLLPDLERVKDEYLAGFSQPQAELVHQILEFFLKLFPESEGEAAFRPGDVLAYWHALAFEPETMRLESDEDKSRLLPLLLEAAKKYKLIHE